MPVSATGSSAASRTHGNRAFATTHWSMVLEAAEQDSDNGRAALAGLCRIYWYPIYDFARRHGQAEEDAKDLTQGFFAQVLAKGALARADAARGKFRTFLLALFVHYRAHQHLRDTRQKRGGGCEIVSLDALQTAETRYQAEPVTTESPEKIFDRKWALSLLEHTTGVVRHEYAVAGKVALFDALKMFLWGGRGEVSYAVIGEQFGMTEGAIKVAVLRLRRRFREQVRTEVTRTLLRAEDADDELRHLFAALGA